jgi:glycosyltransferase involved in cell wall biosynthesis
MNPYLSVVVPAYNEAARIVSTLDSIRTHLDTLAGEYEIIVSADGTDGTRDNVATMAKGDRRIVVIGTPEGAARGAESGTRWP